MDDLIKKDEYYSKRHDKEKEKDKYRAKDKIILSGTRQEGQKEGD